MRLIAVFEGFLCCVYSKIFDFMECELRVGQCDDGHRIPHLEYRMRWEFVRLFEESAGIVLYSPRPLSVCTEDRSKLINLLL